jgi:eukaryotic-like serine/threonine-protein kinase
MKRGTVIQGYRLVSDGSTANSGRSLWAFAAKDGEDYFIKRFLSPKYPVAGAPGSEATKAKQREKCAVFEARQRKIINTLRKSVGRGGNLIFPFDFFRDGSHYYKVSEKVEVSSLAVENVKSLSTEEKLLLFVTIAHSVRILHDAKIVHGDLKPPNILIKRTNKGTYVAKVIDFDDSYSEGVLDLPPDEIVGDPAYYSPELWKLITGKSEPESTPISTRSDVFALGMMFCQYWSGYLPDFDRGKLKYLCNAMLEKGDLKTTGRSLPPPLEDLVLRMLSLHAEDRPFVRDIFTELKALKPADMNASIKPARGGVRSAAGSIFPGVLKSPRKVESPASPPPPVPPAHSGSPSMPHSTTAATSRPVGASSELKGTLLSKPTRPASLPSGALKGRALKPKK